MIQGVANKRSHLRRWWPLIPLAALVAVAAFAWKPLTQASTPEGLFEMALEQYRSYPHLSPFSVTFNDRGMARLAGLTNAEAHSALAMCPIASWRKIGVVPPRYSDDSTFHVWECEEDSALVRGRVRWKPSWGLLGVEFSACRKPECLDAMLSFDPAQYAPPQSPENLT